MSCCSGDRPFSHAGCGVMHGGLRERSSRSPTGGHSEAPRSWPRWAEEVGSPTADAHESPAQRTALPHKIATRTR